MNADMPRGEAGNEARDEERRLYLASEAVVLTDVPRSVHQTEAAEEWKVMTMMTY
jgi:hypothetical protein